MAKPISRKPAASRGTAAPDKASAARRGNANPALTRQARKVMGKHYAAKYGVRKERG